MARAEHISSLVRSKHKTMVLNLFEDHLLTKTFATHVFGGGYVLLNMRLLANLTFILKGQHIKCNDLIFLYI